MRKTLSLIILAVLISGLVTIQPIQRGSAPTLPKVFVDPPETKDPSKNVGSTFTIDVNVSNVVELFGWQINMTFNPAVVNTTTASIVEGPFLSDVYQTQLLAKKVNNTVGTLLVSYMFKVPYPSSGASGNGTLASITFKVRAQEKGTLLQFAQGTKLNSVVSNTVVPILHTTEDGIFDNRIGNAPPVAAFSVDSSAANVSDPVRFDASASYDPDAWLVSYDWDYGDGSTQIYMRERLQNINLTAMATHRYSRPGVFTITLTITDSDGATATATTSVIVKGYPVVIGGFIFHVVVESNSTVSNFLFNQTEKKMSFNVTGDLATKGFCNVTIPVDLLGGPYTVSFDTSPIVVDEKTNGTHVFLYFIYAHTSHLIEIVGQTVATPPVAVFTTSTLEAIAHTQITFNATDSYDPDGTVESYQWDFDDGNITTVGTPIISHAYTEAGEYTVTLTIRDNIQLANSTESSLTIIDYPQAEFTYSPANPLVDETVTFNAAASEPSGGTIENYEWDFGDGSKDTGAIVTRAYSSGGAYTVVLNVTDTEGLWDVETRIVTVEKFESELSILASLTTLSVGETTTINGTITPTRSGVSVTVHYRLVGDAAWGILDTVVTDDQGRYTYDWTPSIIGNYEVKTSWQGDATTAPCESNTQQISVKERPAPINFLYIIIPIVIVVIAVVAVYLLKIRK